MAGSRSGPGSGSGAGNRALDPSGVVSLRPALQALVTHARDELGRYTSLQAILARAHEEMAEQAAEYIAAELQEKIRNRPGGERPQRDTRYLIEAILSKENRDFNPDGFVVGTDYMDRSPARTYYRNLETGTDIFVGREISGFFIGPGSTGYGPSKDRLNTRLIQLGATFGSHPGNATSTIRVGRSEVVPAEGGQRESVRNRRKPFIITIKKPIKPYEYFLDGGERWLSEGNVGRIYEKFLGSNYQLKVT